MNLTPRGYHLRLLDDLVERRLKVFGALEIVGTKFCGKTWTAKAFGESIIHIDDEAVKQMVNADPALSLDGERPHVIDEWQEIPRIWDCVRRKIDESGNEKGQFILTGSSTVDRTRVIHSGAGRIARVHMRPMSLYELGESDGSISLSGLFDGRFTTKTVETDLRHIAGLICQGGWPATFEIPKEYSSDLASQYLDALFNISAPQDGLNPYTAKHVATSLARNTGHSITYKALYRNISEGEPDRAMNDAIYQQKLEPYIKFFKDRFFVEDKRGWKAPVRSISRVSIKPKTSFVDPSQHATMLNITPDRLLHDMQLFEKLFKELCLRDIRVYASAMEQIPEPVVFYYADSDGLEVDIIV
ncbi:MAG: AAA family ATPase [Eggerthellaceae bacterium]|nr:AAA family ATPase [Eggerthellaceae bacterium]